MRTLEIALAEAKVETLKASIRRQLADIVRLREQELVEAQRRVDAKALTSEDLRKAEEAVRDAKIRLADGY